MPVDVKIKIFILSLLLNQVIVNAQFPVHADSLYTFIKYNSIHRNKVNWNDIDTAFHNRIKKARTIKDTMKSFVYVLEQLNDVHSQIYLNNQYYGHYPDFDSATAARLTVINNKANAGTNKIMTSQLPGNIAYIRVPSIQAYGASQIASLTQALGDSVLQFIKDKPRGFIIDLRLNGGGNIYPMLAGLYPLLGDGVVAYETDLDDKVTREWELKEGKLFIGGYEVAKLNTNFSPFAKSAVAILTGPVTKSSGSMTAIAFKGRPNTAFIGESTADGYTTSNGYFQFAPTLVMNFATNFVADRYKHVYKTTFDPYFQVLGGDNFENLSMDEKIIAALHWINKK